MQNKAQLISSRSKICGVYAFEHIPTGMLYIGSSVDCYLRKRAHRQGKGYFFRCATQLGWDSFKFHTLETCLPEDRFRLERDWIVAAGCVRPFGFNVSSDPTNRWGYEFTEETRQKMSEKRKKFFAENPEALVAMSARKKTHCANPEVREAMSLRAKAYFKKNPSHNNKAVNQLSLDGKVVARHISSTAAARLFGRTTGAICFAIRTGNKSGGYLWEYADSDKPAAWVARLGVPHGLSRAVNQFSSTGEFIACYSSLVSAARAINSTTPRLCKAIKRKNELGGFLFHYV